MKLLYYDFTLPYLLKDKEYPVGGWAVELGVWLQGMSAAGHQAGVLTWKGARNYVGRKLDFDLLETFDPAAGIKILKYFYLRLPAILRRAKEYRPDVVVQACCGLETGIMAALSARLGVPFVYRVANDMDVDERCRSRLSSYAQVSYEYGLRKASAIVCQNHYQFSKMRERFPNKPLSIVHNPFSAMYPLPEVQPRRKRTYIAWLGIFSQQKNLPLLCRIAAHLPEVEIRVAGMPSKDLDRGTARALQELQQRPNIKMVGYVKRQDVLGFLAGAQALLSTSHYEGFSNTFLEAFAAGTPIIAPHRVDPDEMIGRNSLGLTSRNDDDLAPLIRELAALSQNEYETLARKCKRYVLEQHAPKAKAEEFVAHLAPLFSGP